MTPAPRSGESPFIQGTCLQWAWDSTSLGALKTCPRKYQLSIVEGWRARDESVYLTFGILFHKAVEEYEYIRAEYTDVWNHAATLRSIVNFVMEKTVGWDTGRTDLNRHNLIRSIVWYLDQFGENDPAKTITLESGKPAVELSFRMDLGWHTPMVRPPDAATTYVLCGHLDRVVSFIGGLYVMDHKTTRSTIGDYYFDRYEPNNQMTLYTIAAKVVFHTPVKGVIIDGVQCAVGFSRFARGLTYRTDAQIQEWLKDLRYWIGQAEKFAADEYWPMNDTACFGCHFNQHDNKICAKDPAVRQAFLESAFDRSEPWNPLQTR
jgi:hypothetical protein